MKKTVLVAFAVFLCLSVFGGCRESGKASPADASAPSPAGKRYTDVPEEKTPGSTPVETAFETAAATPVEMPVETPVETGGAAPEETFLTTPSPDTSEEQTPSPAPTPEPTPSPAPSPTPLYRLSDMIKEGRNFKVGFKLAVYSAAYFEYSIAQGACTDGTYVYFILKPSQDGEAIITKYNLSTGKLVKRSKPIYVFHGNDMTYDTARNIIYVVHGSSEGKILTTVDPETLEVIDQTVNIAKGAGAITYSSTRDRFAISQGGKSLHILDSSLNVIKSVTREELVYTAQGMGSDEDYIYFPMSPKGNNRDNILVVYDWDANYVTTIHLNTDRESESLIYVDGVYYINFYVGDGARLFRLNITPE